MSVDCRTQEHSKKSRDPGNKGSEDGTASGSTNSRDARIQSSSQKSWNDGLRTMRRVQKEDDAEDRNANGVAGMLSDAAKENVVNPKKQGRKWDIGMKIMIKETHDAHSINRRDNDKFSHHMV
ncbi:hypothetical protein BHYA_0056g00200 [Botrytis hyacinthi]|uniref:Uncharacterized protein n=1 Tax=Botrytis hyacinthi TaxID=278943 RepID=A0A4Z1GVS8_9HELO|nr:hypothetical protein BHYA_0056g00200 [Botrytis hyacinthi]